MASVLNHRIEFENSIKVEAFDEDWNSVGVFESIKLASRKLFISNSTIHSYFRSIRKLTRQNIGIKSYKTGKRYHFKIVKNE